MPIVSPEIRKRALIGLAGAAGAGTLLANPDEAEAGPTKEILKRFLRGGTTEASKRAVDSLTKDSIKEMTRREFLQSSGKAVKDAVIPKLTPQEKANVLSPVFHGLFRGDTSYLAESLDRELGSPNNLKGVSKLFTEREFSNLNKFLDSGDPIQETKGLYLYLSKVIKSGVTEKDLRRSLSGLKEWSEEGVTGSRPDGSMLQSEIDKLVRKERTQLNTLFLGMFKIDPKSKKVFGINPPSPDLLDNIPELGEVYKTLKISERLPEIIEPVSKQIDQLGKIDISRRQLLTLGLSSRKKVIGGLATGVGMGYTLAQPQDAEAISASAFWKGSKGAVKHLTRGEQAQVAGAIRKVPKSVMEGIESVKINPYLEGEWHPGVKGVFYPSIKPGKSRIQLGEQVNKVTPVHEALHELYYQILPEDRAQLKKFYQTIPEGTIQTLQRDLGRVRIHTEAEFLSEVGAHILINDPEVIKKIPSNHLAKVVRLIDKYKKPLFTVLGTTGGLAYLSQAKDAEAAPKLKIPSSWPPAKFKKEVLAGGAEQVVGKYAQSSSMESLVEKGIQVQGKTLSGVYKGPGRWRYLTFTDGSMIPTDKDHVRSLVRDFGAQEYTGFMKTRPEKVQVYQAKKSAEQRLVKSIANELSQDEIRDLMGRYISNVEKLTPESMPAIRKVLVQYKGRTFQMPREYAERLRDSNVPKFRILKEFQKKPGSD